MSGASRRLTLGLLATLGFFSAVGTLSSDMYLASFTDIAREFTADPATVQLTLTGFLIGLGVGQFFFGPASDRWGRRPVVVLALGVFAVTSIAMVFAPTLPVLIGLRVVQGFSGSAGVVIARAIVVDLSEGTTAVRPLSLMATFVGLGPLIGPPVGGVLAQVFGWRGVFAVLAALAVAMFVLAVLVVPESLPAAQRHTGGVGQALRRFGALLTTPRFVACQIAFAAGFAAMMAYISASPFVGQSVLGMTPVEYALGFAAGAAALILANATNGPVASRVGPGRMLRVGVGMAVASGLTLIVLSLTGSLQVWSFILCAFVLTGGAGFIMSNASALAFTHADSARGAGSALLGTTQFLLGGLTSPVVGLWGEHTAVPMAVVVFCWAVAALLAATVAVWRRRPSVPAPGVA